MPRAARGARPGLARLALLALAAVAVQAAQATKAAPDLVRAQFDLRLEPATRELDGHGTWTLPAGRTWRMTLDGRYELQRLAVDGRPVEVTARSSRGLREWRFPAAEREQRVEVHWRGRLEALDTTLDHRAVLTHTAAVAAPRGSFMPGAASWHPVFEGAGLAYRLVVDVPESQRAIAPGRLVGTHVAAGRRLQTYAFEQPEPAIDLIAGPYVLTQRDYASSAGRRLVLRALLHPEIAERAAGDLDAVERYLRLYETWIGSYPYESFSIVSSPTPTGFGLPTLTYLGIDVLRLPFIRDTSLGHEVLHNWWGNGVRPDYARGNWSEGLTTFMADYAYREQAGASAALEMRLGWLRDFAALGSAADQPLADFTARTHGAGQVVGYHKAAMLFLMLREAIGTDAFDRALRTFWREHRGGVASWDDLRAAFEAASSRDLRAYFGQWLSRPGAPDLRLAAARAVPDGAAWQVEVKLSQSGRPWQVRVPVVLRFADGSEVQHWLDFDRERQAFGIAATKKPVQVVLDPGARVFRRLAPGEAPPILRQAMLDPATVTVLAGAESAGESLARRLVEHPLRRQSPDAAPPAQPLLVIGLDGDVRRYLERHGLPGRPRELEAAMAQATAWAWTATRAGGEPVTVVAARTAAALTALERPLPHHGRQSWLIFEGPKAIARGTWPSRPQQIDLSG